MLSPGQIIEFSTKETGLIPGIVLSVTNKGVRVLMTNRRETTITERSIIHTGTAIKVSPNDHDACLDILTTKDQRRRKLAQEMDLATLHSLLIEDPRPYSASELAGFLSDNADEDLVASVIRRLQSDALYFRSRKEGFVPVDQAEVEASKLREQQRVAHEQEELAIIAEIRQIQAATAPPPPPPTASAPTPSKNIPLSINGAVSAPPPDGAAFADPIVADTSSSLSPSSKDGAHARNRPDGEAFSGLSERLEKSIEDFVQIAVHGEEAPVSKKIHELVQKAGLGTDRKLFQFLVNLGRFTSDENLLLIKHQVPTAFSTQALEEAEKLCIPATNQHEAAPHDGSQKDVSHKTTTNLSPRWGVCPPKAMDGVSLGGPPVAAGGSGWPAPELSALSSPLAAGRQDLRHMRTLVIDNPGTQDRDDGFSLQQQSDGSFILWVHVADASEFIQSGSALDREAEKRGTTLYLPEGNIPMLPPILSEGCLSLNHGTSRKTLTQEIHINPDGSIRNHRIFPGLIEISLATDYLSADKMAVSDSDIANALLVAESLKKHRLANGAVVFPRRPEAKVSISEKGVEVQWSDADNQCQEMVAEFMICANHLAASWCRENGIPALYRVQDPPLEAVNPGEIFEPVSFFKVIRQLKRSSVSLQPGLHGCLAVNPYTQVTSPIRRYSDLLIQRQIKSFLQERPLIDAETLRQKYMYSEGIISSAEKIMEERQRYFFLKFLRQEQSEGRGTSPATVVDQGMTEVYVFIEKTQNFAHCRKPPCDLGVGQKVTVRFTLLDPFELTLRFEIIPPKV